VSVFSCAIFIGLELEREIYEGELSNIKDALLPIFAALGGMLFLLGSIYCSTMEV
jgi:NhaA family Na+:H+ antiporter